MFEGFPGDYFSVNVTVWLHSHTPAEHQMSDEDRVQQLGGERTAERFAWTVMFTSGGGRDQEQLK